MITQEKYLEAKKIIVDYESEQLNKHSVSGRSELLKAFYLWVDENYALGMLTDKVDDIIEEYAKAFNCH